MNHFFAILNGKVARTQFPLRPAGASTILAGQGSTFKQECIDMDISDSAGFQKYPNLSKLYLQHAHYIAASHVSNLTFLSHLVEKCVLIQFNQHCTDNTLLPDYQSAYRTNYSCETALVALVNDILWGMEKQKITAFTAIDLLAAFNTIDYDILLEVLQMKFSFTGQTLHWFDSYLRP